MNYVIECSLLNYEFSLLVVAWLSGLVGRHSCPLKSIMTCSDMFTLTLVLLEFSNLELKLTVLKYILSEGQSQEVPHL